MPWVIVGGTPEERRQQQAAADGEKTREAEQHQVGADDLTKTP